MQLVLNQKNIKLTSDQEQLIIKRFKFCFSRLSAVIKRVVIYLEDINGPKGGIDKQCKVKVSLHKGEDIIVTEKQSIITQAVEKALQRSSYIARKRRHRKNSV